MSTVAVDRAQRELPELIRRVRDGEEIIITDHDRPVARLEPVLAPRKERRPGRWKGRFIVPERLFEPLTDEELAWLSGERSP
jgi:prevent-host-death family protein